MSLRASAEMALYVGDVKMYTRWSPNQPNFDQVSFHLDLAAIGAEFNAWGPLYQRRHNIFRAVVVKQSARSSTYVDISKVGHEQLEFCPATSNLVVCASPQSYWTQLRPEMLSTRLWCGHALPAQIMP